MKMRVSDCISLPAPDGNSYELVLIRHGKSNVVGTPDAGEHLEIIRNPTWSVPASLPEDLRDDAVAMANDYYWGRT